MSEYDQHERHQHAAHHPQPDAVGLHSAAAHRPAGHSAHHASASRSVAAHHSGHEQMFRTRFFVSLVLTIPVILYSEMTQHWLGISPPSFPGSQFIAPLFAAVIFFYGGLPFLQMAVPELRARQPGMMMLISLAISVSFLYSTAAFVFNLGEGFYWELATLIDIMLLGHWLEMRSVRRASSSLDELAKLLPDQAERIGADGRIETVPAAALAAGDLFLVRPGASIPADGEVVEGNSQVNESMLSGESRPVSKAPGDAVIAGAINGEGSLRVRVTAVGGATALAGIMRLVQQAQLSKSRTQILADRAAGWLFTIALVAAALTALAWGLARGLDLFVLERVVTVLIIACPHALGLAVPLVVAISTAQAASHGLLVKDRLALEEARLVDTVVFDKTGTLTQGEMGVVALRALQGYSEDQVLSLAAGLEGDSEHSLARAIRASAAERGLAAPAVEDFQALKGLGVQATVAGQPYHLGGPRLLQQLDASLPPELAAFAEDSGRKGQSAIYLLAGTQPIAVFAIADALRPQSKLVIDSLRQLGIRAAMLTGDSEPVAAAVAAELGITEFFAEVLPADKEKKIAALQAQGRKVAMVGDGVNDAPALARADVGIAIGSGTDVAVESAGIILVDNDPQDVLKVFRLSRASYAKMVQNLLWATGYNVIAIPLAAGVLASRGILLSPALGAVLMSASTIIVALNAQLLRRARL
ncbi:MAG: heavy metal translocating P-type ATPase [Anaerolineales bacterium]|nr:MAG: heavy metal translocating P-type ATPase [Anaerolineales bacterium]